MPPESGPPARKELVDRIRRRLQRDTLARLQLAVIVTGTGLAGFLIAAGLLALGLDSMAVRYGLSVVGAYATFMGLVRLWIELYRRQVDLTDALDLASEIPGDFDGFDAIGDGGASGGGGADGAWAPLATPIESGPIDASVGETSGGGALDVLDLDEGWLIAIPIMFIGALVASALLIWSGPILLAELVLDVVVVSSLYRRLAHSDKRSWFTTTIRKTWVPALVAAVLVVGAGLTLDLVAPEARTIGEALAGG
jgi:hypothetical protein